MSRPPPPRDSIDWCIIEMRRHGLIRMLSFKKTFNALIVNGVFVPKWILSVSVEGKFMTHSRIIY